MKWNDNSVNYDRPVHHELTLTPHTFSITAPSFHVQLKRGRRSQYLAYYDSTITARFGHLFLQSCMI